MLRILRSIRLKWSNNKLKKQLSNVREEMKLAMDQNTLAFEDEIKSFLALHEMFHSYKQHRFDSLINLCVQNSTFGHDLSILTEKYRLTDREIEKRFHARLMAMMVYEYLLTINSYLGTKLRTDLNHFQYQNYITDLGAIGKEFATLKKENESLIKELRNEAAAHRTPDGIHFAKTILSFNAEKIYDLSIEMIKLNTRLSNKTTEIINEIVSDMKIGNPKFMPGR